MPRLVLAGPRADTKGQGALVVAEMRADRIGLVGLGVVGLAGAVLNFDIVSSLAVAAGYSSHIAWIYWVVLDFFACVAMYGAFRAKSNRVRAWALSSSVLALLLSSTAGGLHVFIVDEHLPQPIAFGVLSAPALLIGLSFHLILMLSLEDGEPVQEEDMPPVLQATAERVPERRSIETTEDTSEVVTETVTTRHQVTARRSGKTAKFMAALAADDGTQSVNAVVEALNTPDIGLHPASARKLVAQHRRSEEV